MIDDFLNDLEDTFGKYRNGMRNAITNKVQNVNNGDLDSLYRYIIQEYDMARPPSLKVILASMYYHNIRGMTPHKYTCSVCEHCGMDFSTNSLYCPHCKKLRIFGKVREMKNKPVWHDVEIRKERKDALEVGDLKKTNVELLFQEIKEEHKLNK